MQEITGDMLRKYAEEHGLEIMPHRDPDEWAERINKNNGMCPCGKECPCEECTCKFFTPPAYTQIQNEEMRNAVKILEETRNELMKMDLKNREEAAEKIKKLADKVKEDAEKHECGVCEDFMSGLNRKLDFLSRECAIDGDSCASERNYTAMRVMEMMEVFGDADKILSEEETSEEKVKDTQEKKPEIPYRQCMSEKLKETFVDLPKEEKFCAAVSMCSGKRMTEEEALEACRSKKDE